MAALTDQFKTALKNIEPSEDDKKNAPAAHAEVQRVLEDDPAVSDWGVKPHLIGSYARHVSIRRMKDVDMFCRLTNLPSGTHRDTILDKFYEVLDDYYGLDSNGDRKVQRQARSLKVFFPGFGLHVDVVPARPTSDDMWEIPERGEDGKWHKTNPIDLANLKTTMNEQQNEKYVPTVKLVRQTRRNLLGKRPGGFWFEMALYEVCKQGLVPADGNQAKQYTAALQGIADLLDKKVDDGVDVPNPAIVGEDIIVRATDNQWDTARTKFREAATKAQQACDSDDRCWAALQFQELLGGNDDFDAVFEMPSECNADGTSKSPSLLGADRNVPAGNRRFG